MDPEVEKILESPEGGAARDRVESAVAASGRIEIAGREYPAPSAAAYALLETIGSPFVAAGETPEEELSSMAVFRALYVLSERENAVAPILRWQRRKSTLEALKSRLDGDRSPQAVLVLSSMLKEAADAEAQFDLAALEFAGSLGAFHVASAAEDIFFYLSACSGFSMIPRTGDGSKKKDITTSNG